ncbi:hypothetical protein NC652_025212 [Populus alba x Populus x berolinensis]|nr:hypothetical protein NC652_025212 [Populus alba x Populus x berolinensis]
MAAGWNREKLPGGVRTCKARDPTNNTWMAIIIFMLDGILSRPPRFSLPAREKSPPDIISLHSKSRVLEGHGMAGILPNKFDHGMQLLSAL